MDQHRMIEHIPALMRAQNDLIEILLHGVDDLRHTRQSTQTTSWNCRSRSLRRSDPRRPTRITVIAGGLRDPCSVSLTHPKRQDYDADSARVEPECG